jgi:hypothetical protein
MLNAFIQGLAKHLMLSPIYFLYGLFALVRAGLRLIPMALRARAAMRDSVSCPNGHPNAVAGRYACGRCRAVYHGWVGRCSVCGAGASWTPCRTCEVAIVLPWERR